MQTDNTDNEAFYQRVANDLRQPALTDDEKDLAFNARQYAELVFEFTGYVYPLPHPLKVVRSAWVLTQQELLFRKTNKVH